MRIFAAAYLALIGGVTSALFMRLKRAADRDELNTERVLLRYGFMYGGRSGNYAGPGYFLRKDARIPTNTASIPPSSSRRYKTFRMGALWWGVVRIVKQASLVFISVKIKGHLGPINGRRGPLDAGAQLFSEFDFHTGLHPNDRLAVAGGPGRLGVRRSSHVCAGVEVLTAARRRTFCGVAPVILRRRAH